MKEFHRPGLLLAVCLLALGMMLPVSAFSVSSVVISPPGNPAPGTSMTVSFLVDFPKGGTESFPATSELKMRTDLAEAYWVPVLVLDGEDTRLTIQSGESCVVSGWYLAYPAYQDVHLKVTVTGKIPENPSGRQDLMRINEVDSTQNSVATAHIAMPEAPMMSLPVQTAPPVKSGGTAATTKPRTTVRTFTPIPTDTTPASPSAAGAGILAMIGAALLVLRRK